MLKIQNLSFSYAARQVLKNINLDVKKGETLALLGPNGSGKSTLLRAICGLLTCTHGSVSLDGHPLASMRPAERARWISVVPQKCHPAARLHRLGNRAAGPHPAHQLPRAGFGA